ncbi:MAG: ADP-ribosylation factor-like protein [Candidatus Hodarchaeota archaeon]
MSKLAKILLYGLEKSGKSTLISSFLEGSFITDVAPTAHKLFEVPFDEDISFEISEVGGSKETALFALRLLRTVDAIIFVIDGSNDRKFNDVKIEFEKIMQHPDSGKKPIAILFNKVDIATVAPSIVINQLQILKMIDRPHTVFSTTAKAAQDFVQVLSWLKDRLTEKEELEDGSLDLFEINILDMLRSSRTLSFLALLGQLKFMMRAGHGDYNKDSLMATLRKLMATGYIDFIEEIQAYKITDKGRGKLDE